MNTFIYEFFDPREPQKIIYVGMTVSGPDRPNRHITKAKNGSKRHPYFYNKIRSLLSENVLPEWRLKEECQTKEECFSRERFWINEYKRLGHPLTNLSAGGEGSPGNKSRLGKKHSAETKKIMSEKARGEKNSNAKLSIKDIKAIKKLYVEGLLQKEIASMFGVRQPTISKILLNQRWKYAEQTKTNLDIRRVSLKDIEHLFKLLHGYKSVGAIPTYAFAVFEENKPVAAFTWQPATPGTAKSVCPDDPNCVLALSRMVAVPKTERFFKHISKPLMVQMKQLIDRTRWPVLVTYSDESLGHNGYVYKCSGWTPTARTLTKTFEIDGVRVSTYKGGEKRKDANLVGEKYLQRWEHWICPKREIKNWLNKHGWTKVEIPNKKWRSGKQAYKWVKQN